MPNLLRRELEHVSKFFSLKKKILPNFSKKAQEAVGISYRTIISLVLVVEVMLGLMVFIYGIKSGNVFEEHFIARDIATLIDAITISPNDIAIDYPRDTNALAISIEKEHVLVYKPPKFTSLPEQYPYSEDKNIGYDYKEISPSEGLNIRPRFIKHGNHISITGERYSTEGIEVPDCNNLPERESFSKSGKLTNLLIKDTQEPAELLADRGFIDKEKTADAVVIITSSDEIDESVNPIYAYINADSKKFQESRYFACLIIRNIMEHGGLNSLITDKELKEFTVQNTLSTDKYALSTDNLAILLKIGNTRIREDKNLLSYKEQFTQGIKEAIYKAIDEYG